VYMIDKNNTPEEHEDDIIIEEESEEVSSFKPKTEEKKKSELEVCKEERQEYLDGWQRSRAEFANYKITQEKRLSDIGSHAGGKIVGDILPVLDSFDMAMANTSVWESVDENWRVGIEYIHSQFHTILEQHGLSIIQVQKGDNFNPELHEVLEVEKLDNNENHDKILSVRQTGYLFKEKVLRPAKVVIGQYEA
jgi:molecular chaperone GrpE